MILNLNGNIGYSTLESLVHSLNSLEKKESLCIYFTAPEGGDVDVAIALLDIINANTQRVLIKFYGEIFSSGMYLFLQAKCNKEVLFGTRGMLHLAHQRMTILEGGEGMGRYDKFCLQDMKNSKNLTVSQLHTFKLNSKEILEIKKGKDVYFTYERLLQLI